MQVRTLLEGLVLAEGPQGLERVNTALVGDCLPGEWVLVFLGSARERIVELVLFCHAPRCVQAREQRMHAGLLQRPRGARGNLSCYYFHSCSRMPEKR